MSIKIVYVNVDYESLFSSWQNQGGPARRPQRPPVDPPFIGLTPLALLEQRHPYDGLIIAGNQAGKIYA
jgi:hypothetical protein